MDGMVAFGEYGCSSWAIPLSYGGMGMMRKSFDTREKIGTNRTEGRSGLPAGSLRLCPIVRGIGYVIMRGLQVADDRFALKRCIAYAVGAYHAVEHGYEDVQNENGIDEKIS